MCLGNKLSNNRICTLTNDIRSESSIVGDKLIGNCEIIDLITPVTDVPNYINFTKSDSLNIMHLNIHSMRAKRDMLLDLIVSCEQKGIKLHVICLCETYTNDLNLADCKIDGYNMIVRHRTSSRGGGICILIKSEITYEEIVLNNCEDKIFEVSVCKLKVKGKNIIISEVYRSPNTNLCLFHEKYKRLLSDLTKLANTVIVCGDFNIDLKQSVQNSKSKEFIDINYECGFFPTVFLPTRTTHSTSTVIDNIFVYDKTNHLLNPFDCETAIITDDISDHVPCIMRIPNCLLKGNDQVEIEFRKKVKDYDVKICHDLLYRDWTVLENMNVNDGYNYFINQISNSMNTHMPIHKKLVDVTKPARKFWFSDAIVKCIKKRKSLYKKSLKKGDEEALKRYRLYRNSLNRIILFEKRKFFSERFKKYKDNANVTWGLINSLIGKSSNKLDCINMIKTENGVSESNPEIARVMNKHFTSVSAKLEKSLKKGRYSHKFFLEKQNKTSSSFSLRLTNETEIDQIISNIKPKSSAGHDGISNVLLKRICPAIRTPLTLLCNSSISSVIFPDQMKIAKVKPLFKSGSKSDLNNYRPISLLPVCSKVLEKVILKQIQKYMQDTGQYNKNQFGFRKNSNTGVACQNFLTEILKNHEDGNIVVSVFIDLKKAFDTCQRDILLDKLEYYGFDNNSLSWFNSYLSERKQFTQISVDKSDTELLSGCIAQGSNLGPELFLYQINDLRKSLRYSDCILFADDTTIYIIGKNLRFLKTKLQADVDMLSEWLLSNRLALNVSKTKLIIFSKTPLSYDNFDIVIDGEKIEIVNDFKFLGVYFNHDLKFETHVNMLLNKLKLYHYKLKMISQFIDNECKNIYYHAFIKSRIEYCIQLWLPLISRRNSNLLQRELNKIHKLLPAAGYDYLSMDSLSKLQMGCYVYKYENNLLPDGLRCKLLSNGDVHKYETRSRNQPRIAKHQTNKYNQSFLVQSVMFWNSLPIVMRLSKNITIFKNMCKKYLMNSQNPKSVQL